MVLQGAWYPGDADAIVRAAVESGDYELVRQIGTDYLIRVRPK